MIQTDKITIRLDSFIHYNIEIIYFQVKILAFFENMLYNKKADSSFTFCQWFYKKYICK